MMRHDEWREHMVATGIKLVGNTNACLDGERTM
ncbi:hypothetical protein CBA19C6_19585 [Cupriavidus pauculus]|nr:hypothetical protein CBA19C6_19585 [Cupriavidus pauculus]